MVKGLGIHSLSFAINRIAKSSKKEKWHNEKRSTSLKRFVYTLTSLHQNTKAHRINEKVVTLVNSSTVMRKLHFLLQYGNYLAWILKVFRTNSFSEANRMSSDRLSVAKSSRIQVIYWNTHHYLKKYFPYDLAYYSNVVVKAATILEKNRKQVVFAIEVYTARNQACRNDLKILIHNLMASERYTCPILPIYSHPIRTFLG